VKRMCSTKLTPLIAGLLLAILAVPLSAQPVHESHPFYDITKEITISGAATSVLKTPAEGMILGSHLLVETASGTVDASLGKWGLQGKSAPSIAIGEQVTLRGVMKTVRERQVFFVRTVEAGGHTYTMRNVHGVPVSPQSRERVSQKTAQKGESL